MSFVNVGACYDNGERIRTKKELKAALATASSTVVFDKTSYLDSSGLPRQIKVSDLTSGVKLSVCGPDPYERRQWWATVENKSGKITVK
jgi:hypothetical protein